jgi:hypothetical protein
VARDQFTFTAVGSFHHINAAVNAAAAVNAVEARDTPARRGVASRVAAARDKAVRKQEEAGARAAK